LPNERTDIVAFLAALRPYSAETGEISSGIDRANHRSMPSTAELDRIAYEIVGAGVTVHSRVGTGCFESTYTPCFGCELRKRGLAYRTKVAIPLQYEDITIRRAFEADFIVEGPLSLNSRRLLRSGGSRNSSCSRT
jgi:hypothetical protein